MTARRRLVRVPASSANLGPGYDVLAAAVDDDVHPVGVVGDRHPPTTQQRGRRARARGRLPGLLGTRVAVDLPPGRPRLARRGHVSHHVYDHTSVLKMIEWRWGLKPLTPRDKAARNMAESLDFESGPNLTTPT